eukprot:TRINITY_DN37284_c0_g1_i1.p1 TRINITY_DN37284_c0_g1~~TRINITY_DN37284_c0_g1_i1.p1  ORF type:complete len:329 (+),score=58.70 TRINITY_DN37284_c0_g1_i1:75-1061(+)
MFTSNVPVGFVSGAANLRGSIVANPRRRAARPRLSVHSVANEVLLPCGKAVCWAPFQALAVLGTIVGYGSRSKRPAAPKLSQPSLAVIVPPAKENIADGLTVLMEQCSSMLAETANGFMTAAEQALEATLEAMHINQKVSPVSSVGMSKTSADSCGRHFLKPGSWYQNSYMSLWNNSNAPVSSVLHVTSDDEFELKVTQLDSKNGGSDGWVIFRSSFDVEPVPEKPHRMRLNLRHNPAVNTLEYDDGLFDRSANFMLSVMRRATCLLLSAFSLEIDMEEHIVYCGARAGIVQKFWATPVGLSLTEKDSLWSFDRSEAICSENMATSLA